MMSKKALIYLAGCSIFLVASLQSVGNASGLNLVDPDAPKNEARNQYLKKLSGIKLSNEQFDEIEKHYVSADSVVTNNVDYQEYFGAVIRVPHLPIGGSDESTSFVFPAKGKGDSALF